MSMSVETNTIRQSNGGVRGASGRGERRAYIQRNGPPRARALESRALQTGHDHAGIVRFE